MSDNGNRGPNDFRARGGRKRREPPIIDASATEVPADPSEAESRTGASFEPEHGPPPSAEEGVEPVLFGSAARDTAARDVAAGEAAAPEPDAPSSSPVPATVAEPSETVAPLSPAPEDLPGQPAAAEAERRETEAAPADAASTWREGRSEAAPPTVGPRPSRSGAGLLPTLLGLACLALLAAVAWLLYSEPQRSGRQELAATVTDLQTKVAALEARPDPTQAQGKLQGDLAALGQRVGAADSDRSGLAKAVAELNTRLDAVAEQAQAAKAAADRPPEPPAAAPADATPAFATAAALTALAARVDGLDRAAQTLTEDQGRIARQIADLPKPVAPDFGPVEAKIAALGDRVTAADGKLNGADARFNDIDAKVNGVVGKVNGSDARMNGLDTRVNGLESKVDQEAAQMGKLQSALDSLPKVDLGPLQAAAAALDARVAQVEDKLAAPKNGARLTEARAVGSADETRATPLAVVGQAIADAIADGVPYGSDLDALKALGVEPETVARLQPMAAEGAPTASALKDRWDAVRDDVLAAVKPAETGGTLDRFAARARALVQVRRVGSAPGEDASAGVSGVDAALGAGDVAAAVAAWDTLPDAGKDKSRDWAALARGQVDAAAAAQAVVTRAIATLARSKS